MRSILDGLTYDDVLLVPKYSEIKSRADVKLDVEVCKGFKFRTPLIPSNMKDIFEEDMALTMYGYRGLGMIHRFMSFEEKIELLVNIRNKTTEDVFNYIGVSVGIQEKEKAEIEKFIQLGVKIISIDVAHLDNKFALEMVKYVSETYPSVLLVAGSVVNKEASIRAWEAGADIIRIGVGSGSICITRIEAASGCPQLTAIIEAKKAKEEFSILHKNRKVFFIADGGTSKPADFCKALCFADMVMAGNMFAGTDETPGQIIEIDGKKYKQYNGSSTHKKDRVEGVKASVPYKGPVHNVFKRIHEGIQSCCSYQGVNNLNDLKKDPEFIRITNAGLIESHAHNVYNIKEN